MAKGSIPDFCKLPQDAVSINFVARNNIITNGSINCTSSTAKNKNAPPKPPRLFLNKSSKDDQNLKYIQKHDDQSHKSLKIETENGEFKKNEFNASRCLHAAQQMQQQKVKKIIELFEKGAAPNCNQDQADKQANLQTKFLTKGINYGQGIKDKISRLQKNTEFTDVMISRLNLAEINQRNQNKQILQ